MENPHKLVSDYLNEQGAGTRKINSTRQRMADSDSTVVSELPRKVWSIKIPKVYCEGTGLAHGQFEHLMFVSGTEGQARKVARTVTGLTQEAEERPNWIVVRGAGEEVVINAKKFLNSKG